jgi:lipopolysaccharide biosynthesis protein
MAGAAAVSGGGARRGGGRQLLFSLKHRVQTRVRLARMRPRRSRALAALVGQVEAHPSRRGADEPPSTGRHARVLVILHVFYADLWPELRVAVGRIPEPVDVVVTLVRGVSDDVAARIGADLPGAVVRVVENRGRDIWPMLQVLDLLPGHDIVLKLHTKRSPHMRSGDQWRRDLIAGLCGSSEQISGISRLLRTQPLVGMVAPGGNVFGREFLGANTRRVSALAARADVPFDADRLWFPAGSMFWARAEVLAEAARLGLTAEDFEPEAGTIDGTTAHAVERYLGVVLAARDLAIVESPLVERLLEVGS